MKDLSRSHLFTLLKVIVMLLLLAFIARQVHWLDYQLPGSDGQPISRPGLFSCLSGIRLLPYLFAVSLQFVTIYLTAYRWRLLMMIQGIDLDNNSVMRLSFLSEFFNNFLPGAMGGDAVKAIYVIRHTGKKSATLVSIFANRFAGLLVMVAVSAIMLAGWLLIGNTSFHELKQPLFSIMFVASLIIIVLFLSLSERLNNSEKIKTMIKRLPLSRHLETLRQAMHRHRRIGKMLVPILLYSIMIVIAFISSVILVGWSLGINLAWYYYFVYMPLIMIMTAVPITPGGVGVMEELFLYFFAAAGDPQKVLALALLYRLTLIICSLPGVLIFFSSTKIDRNNLKRELEELETDEVVTDTAR